MPQRRQVLVLMCVAAMAMSASAQVEPDASTIGDRYLAAMQRKGYSFLSKDELIRRRNQIAAFAGKHLRQPLDKPAQAALLDGIDRCIARLYTASAGQVFYGNGFGSGGEEWMYLHDPDYFLTFEYHLWVGLTRHPLSPVDVQRRDAQQKWLRRYLADLPYVKGRESLPREGMRDDEVRPWVREKLEKAFVDPMDLLSEPMSDAGFATLQDRFKQFSSGIRPDFNAMEVAALTSRFPTRKDPASRFGYAYPGVLPFDDTVVNLWGTGPSLCFASNADFCGNHGGLSEGAVYDVVRCNEMYPADFAQALAIPGSRVNIEAI